MVKAISDGRYHGIRCFVQTLNLVVITALKKYEESTEVSTIAQNYLQTISAMLRIPTEQLTN